LLVVPCLGGILETLPGKRSLEEVDEDIGKGFQVVTAGILDTQMSVD
jgi:hypothetical protein